MFGPFLPFVSVRFAICLFYNYNLRAIVLFVSDAWLLNAMVNWLADTEGLKLSPRFFRPDKHLYINMQLKKTVHRYTMHCLHLTAFKKACYTSIVLMTMHLITINMSIRGFG
jgi:hypothetical protein